MVRGGRFSNFAFFDWVVQLWSRQVRLVQVYPGEVFGNGAHASDDPQGQSGEGRWERDERVQGRQGMLSLFTLVDASSSGGGTSFCASERVQNVFVLL